MDGIKLLDGEFWIPQTDYGKKPGYLRVGPQLAPTVELIEELTPWMKETERREGENGNDVIISVPVDDDDEASNGPFLIHGITSAGTKITLVDAITVHRSIGTESKQRLQGIQAVVGCHLTGREHQFSDFRVRLRNLDSWRPLLRRSEAQPPGWMAQTTLDTGGTISIQTSYSPRVWLVGQDLNSFTFRGLDRGFERPLVSLFTLATGIPCDVLDIQVKDKSAEGQWWDVYTSSLQNDDGSDDARRPHSWLLKTTDLHLHHVAAWINRVDQLGPLPPAVADLAGGGTISIEAQVLQLTTIAEGLHRALFNDQYRFGKEVSVSIRDAAVAATREILPDATDTVRGLLNYLYEPSYAQRLQRLADEGSAAVPGVTGRTNRWKEIVSGARNNFAHRLKGEFMQSKDVDRYLTVALSLRWLLTGLLLTQAEIPPSVLAQRFNDYDEYAYFIKAARQWQPRVYAT